ncbi:MAG: DUF4149 domain-containing protein [Burkholderiaceae bacterium]
MNSHPARFLNLLRRRVPLLAAALWWGSLTALGAVVVPLLFVHLPTPAMAGALAAKLFTAQTWLGIGCAGLLLLLLRSNQAVASEEHAHDATIFVVIGLLLVLLLEFGVASRITAARALGADIKLWHGVGSAMFALQWLSTGVVLWRLAGGKPAGQGSAEL